MTCQNQTTICPDRFGCPPGVCPDFELKRHDTKPSFKITVSDCDGPLDLTDCVVEVSMWAKGKLKRPLTSSDTYFALADNIGFDQSLVGDIILMDRVRAPEQMLVIGHDETNKLIQVQRGYNGTLVGDFPRGTSLRIFRVLNATGSTNVVEEDVESVDGTVAAEEIESQLVYDWAPNDTCLPGCYWLEFKLLKMAGSSMWVGAAGTVVPSFISVTPETAGCELGTGVEWVRRFPIEGEGFLIHITDSPTSEILTA